MRDIPYYYDRSREPKGVNDDEVIARLQAAAAVWDAVPLPDGTHLNLVYKGLATVDLNVPKDAHCPKRPPVNVVTWASITDGFGVACPYFDADDPTGLTINGFLILLNNTHAPYTGDSPLTAPVTVIQGGDLQSVATHELGHVLGLFHSPNPDAVVSNAQHQLFGRSEEYWLGADFSKLVTRNLNQDDISALQYQYSRFVTQRAATNTPPASAFPSLTALPPSITPSPAVAKEQCPVLGHPDDETYYGFIRDDKGVIYLRDQYSGALHRAPKVNPQYVTAVTLSAACFQAYRTAFGQCDDSNVVPPIAPNPPQPQIILGPLYVMPSTTFPACRFALQVGGAQHGPSSNGAIQEPNDIAVDSRGDLYVKDYNGSFIQIFAPSGSFVAQWQGANPRRLAIDRQGNVYVLDEDFNAIIKYTSSGQELLHWGSEGRGPAQFTTSPARIAVSDDGNVYVTNLDDNRIERFDTNGTFITQWVASGTQQAPGSVIGGIAADSFGHIFVSIDDVSFSPQPPRQVPRVQEYDAQGKLLAEWAPSLESDSVEFDTPEGLATDALGDVYVADAGKGQVDVFDGSGKIIGIIGQAGDGGNGQFDDPDSVAVDSSGNVYVADSAFVQKFVAALRH